MKLKREIELFWIRHSGRILFWIGIFAAVILVTQGLNKIAEKKLEEQQKEISINKEIDKNKEEKEVIKNKENKNNTELIKNFINICNENKIEEAYNMLSEKCKKEKYKTLEEFLTNYYKKYFKENYSCENIEFDYEKNIYIVTFYESALSTGNIKNRNSMTSNLQIEVGVLESKINVLE